MPKKVSDVKLKTTISEVLLYRDRLLKANAKRNDRDNIQVEDYPVLATIVAVFTPTMEVGYVKRSLTERPTADDIIWTKIGVPVEVEKIEEYKPITERHTDEEVEFNDEQIELIKKFFEERSDLATFVEYQLLKEWLYDTTEKEIGSEGLVNDKNVVDESEGK